MNKIVGSFEPQTLLHEIVGNSTPGVFFFQDHNHVGSYQILVQSMEGFADNKVKILFLELATDWNDALALHAQGNPKPLKKKLECLKKLYEENLLKVIEKAHEFGIKTIAVDPGEVIVRENGVIGSKEKHQESLNARISQDQKIVKNIRKHLKALNEGEKCIGLFGGSHIEICNEKMLNIPSLLIQAHDGLKEVKQMNLIPSELEGLDEKTNKHLKQFDIVTLTHPNLEDEIDFSKEETNSKGLLNLNKLLKKFKISMSCKSYGHTNSEQIDGVAVVSKEKASQIWNKVCELLDGLPKRMINEENGAKIIFSDIDSEEVLNTLNYALNL